MSLRFYVAAAAVLAVGSVFAQSTQGGKTAPSAAPAASQKPPAPLTPADKPNLSYGIGFMQGSRLAGQKLEIDLNQVIKGIQDGYAKKTPAVSEDVLRDVLSRADYQMNAQHTAELEKLSSENKAQSARFMAENKSKKGVVTLPSGVQYVVIEEGSGSKHPTMQSEVTVNLRISKTTGLEVFSSFQQGEPLKIKVSEGLGLKGWQDIVPLMKVGDYWRVFLPPELAFGDRGDGRAFGPSEIVVLEMKLLDIKP